MSTRKIIQGSIDDVRDGIVCATLVDASGWSYYAEIDLDRFSDADQPGCTIGARFTISEPGPVLRMVKRRLVNEISVSASE